MTHTNSICSDFTVEDSDPVPILSFTHTHTHTRSEAAVQIVKYDAAKLSYNNIYMIFTKTLSPNMQLLHYPGEVFEPVSSGNYHPSVQMKHAVLSTQLFFFSCRGVLCF